MSSTPYSLYSAPSLEGPTGPAGSAGATGATGPSSGGGPFIQSGSVDLAINGQTVILPIPYSSTLQVFVQGTSNKAGVNGFFTVVTFGAPSQFYIYYSGELIYGPIEVFWMTRGT